MSSVKMPQYMWFNPKDVEYPFPDSWKVNVYDIAGDKKPVLKPDKIKAAIAKPIGMPPLREFARGKKQVAILFDDMSRGTRVAQVVPFVMEELAEAGIKDNQIRFIAAVANHMALDRAAMVKKLGEDIVRRFPVYNHTSFIHCVEVGTSSYGTKIAVNEEVMKCDLKISIGSVVPHPQYGFGGGAQKILPGGAAYETVKAHHNVTHEAWKAEQRKKGLQLKGTIEGSPINADAREAAKMAGLNMVIDCLINSRAETTDVFAGALEPTYQAAVKEALRHYLATNSKDSDIVIANAFSKASEYTMASSAMAAMCPKGGSIVFMANSPSGQVIHYLFDAFGKSAGYSGSGGGAVPPHIKNYIIYSEWPEGKLMERFVNDNRASMTSDWQEVISRLEKSHGAGSRVAVYPSADILYFA
jgi:nickel-dependent lactate racemase